MQTNKLRMAIRATAALAAVGIAGQAHAFSFSAGDVDAELYGYARLNMSYDIDEDMAGPAQEAYAPGLSGDDRTGHFGASAEQSRVGIRTTHSSGVMINVEGDFYGGDFRLRHAYGSYNGILAGQTWSNYNSFVGTTPTLDFNGPAGNPGYQLRTAQLRYTTGPMSFSVEEPNGSLDNSNSGADKRDSSPALTARLEDSAGALSYSAAALVKQNTFDNGNDDDSEIGYGVFGAATMALTDMFSIQGAVNYTDGASDYLYLSGGTDGYVDGNNSVESNSGIGGTVGTSMNLGGGRSVNLAYGMTKLDVDDYAVAGNDPFESTQTVFLNYMWTPIQDVMMGVEYGYFQNETEGGSSNEANRLMFATQYNF